MHGQLHCIRKHGGLSKVTWEIYCKNQLMQKETYHNTQFLADL